MGYELQRESFLSVEKGTGHLKTVLIIDNDLGFVFWLGHVLDAASYLAFPARSVPDAVMLVMQLGLSVDILAINPSLPGASDLIASVHRSQRDVRVVGILNEGQEIIRISGVNAARPKPDILDERAKAEWLECVEQVCYKTATI